MTDPAARVSVIIPCYKQAHFLPASVGSALEQSHPNVEIIVIDDGSPDDTPAVAATFGDRIVYHRQPNAGLAAARNKGLSLATGAFIAFLDSDDALEPAAIGARLAAFDAPSVLAVCCGWRDIDADGRVTAEHPLTAVDTTPYLRLLTENIAPPVCWMVRRSVFDKTGAFDHRFYGHEDWDLWLRIAALPGSEIRFLPEPLVQYRIHGQSMTSSRIRSMFRGGRDVLLAQRKNQQLSPEARRVISRGLRNFRQQYLGRSISRALAGPGRIGSLCSTALEMAGELVRDPVIAWDGLRGVGTFAARGFRWPFKRRG